MGLTLYYGSNAAYMVLKINYLTAGVKFPFTEGKNLCWVGYFSLAGISVGKYDKVSIS